MDFNSFTRARQYTYNLILQAHKKSNKKKKYTIYGAGIRDSFMMKENTPCERNLLSNLSQTL